MCAVMHGNEVRYISPQAYMEVAKMEIGNLQKLKSVSRAYRLMRIRDIKRDAYTLEIKKCIESVKQ